MTSLDHELRQIQDFLAANSNASVRVKFHGSDAFRNFPSHTVTNDTLSDTTDTGVVFDDLDLLENDTRATLERHFSAQVSQTLTPRKRNPIQVPL